MAVVWRAEALADIGRIVRYIAADNPAAARRIGLALHTAGEGLEAFPRRGRAGRVGGTREWTIVPPYVIAYRVTAAGDVTILRIWHAAQNRR